MEILLVIIYLLAGMFVQATIIQIMRKINNISTMRTLSLKELFTFFIGMFIWPISIVLMLKDGWRIER